MIEGYIPKEQRKKILLLSDDLRFTSGIGTISREFVIGTSHRYNWIQLGGSINHPEFGKKLDLSTDVNKNAGIDDSSVFIYPVNGYGDPNILRQIMAIENPDAVMIFTDPRYWIWLFQMEAEIRKKCPILYLNIWDDEMEPLYNFSYYASCDLLMNISKQTHNLVKKVLAWGDHEYEEINLK
jgi:hypothetical protein